VEINSKDIEELKKEIKHLKEENQALRKAIKEKELKLNKSPSDYYENDDDDWKYGSD
tara:strand:+ start:332 stop:502 length:171 start_codon:yes stop_codon:yes gene_type:complete